MGRTEKRAERAEFCRIAVALRRARRSAFAEDLVECLAGAFEHAANMAVLGVAVEYARQEIVDGDIACCRLPGETAGKADQAGTGAVRQPKLGFRACAAARDEL